MPPARREQHVPTLRFQWLGQRMRDLRNAAGLRLVDAADYLGCDHSALAREERAEWPFKRAHVLQLLDLYEIRDPEQRRDLLRRSEEAWREHIVDTDAAGSIHGDHDVTLTWLEKRAAMICVYAPLVPPGLVQTAGYAAAVMRFDDAVGTGVPDGVELRLARQALLDGPEPVRFSTVIEETALRRRMGTRAVLVEQLRHLLEVGRRPTVEIRVLPADTRRSGGAWGQFTLLRMPEPYGSVAYLENLAGRFYFESPLSRRFVTAYDRLRKAALPREASAALIASIAEERP